MNLKQFSEKFLYKWQYKLACLGLAIVVYIIHGSMEYDTKNLSIPITIVEDGAVVDLGSEITKVQLRVRSDTDTIASLHESDFTAAVNLNNIAESGEYQVPIFVTINKDISDKAVFELKQKPQNIKLKVEKKDVGYIKLEPTFVGEPTHGYEVASYTIEPEYVEVVGPQTMLKTTQSIKTEKIDLTDVKNDFSVEVKSRNPNSVLQISDKGPYKVKVIMTASKIDRVFEKVPLNFRGLSSDLILIGEYPEITFTLNGAMNSLENYELSTSAVYLDLSSIKEAGTYELPVQFTLPGYYTVVEKSVENIIVTVEKVQEQSVPETVENAGGAEANEGEKTE